MDIPVIEENGKKVFVGQEDPRNPPVRPQEGSKMECPVCHGMFDYLVGEDDNNGGRMGCEGCWKPPTKKERRPDEISTKPVFD